MGLVLAQPHVEVEVVGLLRPQHAGQRLAHDRGGVVADRRGRDRRVELVGLGAAGLDDRVEADEGVHQLRLGVGAQPHPHGHRALGGHHEPQVGGRLGALPGGVDGVGPAVDDVVVDAVLHVGGRVLPSPQARGVALVLAEQQLGAGLDVEQVPPELVVVRLHDRVAGVADGRQPWPGVVGRPRPRVAVPQRRQHVDRRVLGTSVVHGDPAQEVVGGRLGVLHHDVEVAVLVEDAGVHELEFELVA
jgi:hypothetical protein